MKGARILLIRLGAMGDVIHALPAAATVKASFPDAHLAWCIDRKWSVLLAGNRCLDEVVAFDRKHVRELLSTASRLRAAKFDIAIDVQGLMKSAVLARITGAETRYGFHHTQAREGLAAWLYSNPVRTSSKHVVDQNLEIVRGAGARETSLMFPLPPGRAEGDLPRKPFVLSSPLAGWKSKQWPIEYFTRLGELLRNNYGMELVLNVPPGTPRIDGARIHTSSIEGLIHATRAATAVVGMDSGPLHLAAALGKPGVAIFGPTDPERNGPYGDTITTLRSPDAVTSYKRDDTISHSMRAITPEAVLEALQARIQLGAAR
ncbi:MAG TPA: glycosyltransferase family 9 protein [Bryobacteraceae bacterium]|nr:glycosyltransferase family 9 protein [Bryobacteraceae bacterium]